LNTVMSFGMHHLWRWRATAVATKGAARGEALDLATGTGDFALELAARPSITRVVGLDFAPQMLALARKKARRNRLGRIVQWVQGDALALPFPADHFSCVTSGFGLRNFADMEVALREMVRVARPGGRVVILDIAPLRGRGPVHRFLRLYFSRVVPRMGALLAKDAEGYTYLPQSVENFLGPQDLAHMMERSGLDNVTYRMMGFGTVAIHSGEKPNGAGTP
ncbi:MAG: ubiquinone/menaquinone biosynthesis methyltransferase, partial [Chloroflexi bacterium]|nr:ubiquinone/menaquinone biosynthesis methyltransferase [Chloroflexota bacterium]